mgnify:CR=1 FL=1
MPYVRSIEVSKIQEIATHLIHLADVLQEEHVKPDFYHRETIDHVINVGEREEKEEAWDEMSAQCSDYGRFLRRVIDEDLITW